MLLSLAATAAAAVFVSPTGDSAQVRVPVAGLERNAAHVAIGKGARLACKAIATDGADFAQCVDEAVRRARLDYEKLAARRSVVIATAD